MLWYTCWYHMEQLKLAENWHLWWWKCDKEADINHLNGNSCLLWDNWHYLYCGIITLNMCEKEWSPFWASKILSSPLDKAQMPAAWPAMVFSTGTDASTHIPENASQKPVKVKWISSYLIANLKAHQVHCFRRENDTITISCSPKTLLFLSFQLVTWDTFVQSCVRKLKHTTVK